MTVAVQTPISSYTGNGVTTAFSFGYYVAAQGDLVVMVDGVVKALTTDYTLTGIGSGSGGTCTFVTAPASGADVVLYRDTDLLRETDYQDNGDLLAAIVNGDFDRIWLALQETINGAKLSPRAIRAPVGETLNELSDAASRAGKILSFNASTGQPEAVAPTSGTATDLAIQLASTASGDGAEMIGFLSNATSATPATVDEKLNSVPLDPVVDFNVDNTGATNCTAALKLWFDAVIVGGYGHIPAGTYKVTPGVLAFDNGWVDTPFPVITTDGHAKVIFQIDSATPTDAPILSFTNGTASSGAGNFWEGGELGGITFIGLGSASPSSTTNSQHALQLRGIWKTKFGWLKGELLGGSVVYMEEKLFGGSNPDPYNVGFCDFQGIESNYCKWAFENQNWVGLSHNRIGVIRAIGNRSGVMYGPGTCTEIDRISAGTNSGWVIDDGTASAATGGTPSRLRVQLCELDDCQNGFRFNRIVDVRIDLARLVHRYNFTAWNPSEGYWPRKVMDFCSGVSPSVSGVRASFFQRIESGGAVVNLGEFSDFNSSNNVFDVVINNRISDNGGIGVTSDLLSSNPPSSTGRVIVQNDGLPVQDTSWRVACLVRAAAGGAVGTAGYASLTAKIAFATELYDRGGYYDTANSWFTVPYSGLYRVSGRVTLVPNAASTTLFLGFGAAVAGVMSATVLDKRFAFAAGVASTTFDIDSVVSLTAGQQIFLMAVQNGGSSNLASPISDTANQTWSIEAL